MCVSKWLCHVDIHVYGYYPLCSCVCVTPELQKKPVDGFSAGLIDDDDFYKWEVLIMGPPDTY